MLHTALVGATGVLMCAVSVLWWDREFDQDGRTIRIDVRAAGRQLWDTACQQTSAYLGDATEAPGIMEISVAQISRYLDRRIVPLFEQDPSALLICAFYRRLRRQVSRRHRFEFRAEFPSTGDYRSTARNADCRLDAEKMIRQLSKRAREMFELRRQGYHWAEVAELLDTTHNAARAEFSREIRRLREKFATCRQET